MHIIKIRCISWVLVAHMDPSSRLVWSVEQVTEQPGL